MKNNAIQFLLFGVLLPLNNGYGALRNLASNIFLNTFTFYVFKIHFKTKNKYMLNSLNKCSFL